jgi:hypothetical protein
VFATLNKGYVIKLWKICHHGIDRKTGLRDVLAGKS